MFSFIELHCGFHSMYKAVLYENLQQGLEGGGGGSGSRVTG